MMASTIVRAVKSCESNRDECIAVVNAIRLTTNEADARVIVSELLAQDELRVKRLGACSASSAANKANTAHMQESAVSIS